MAGAVGNIIHLLLHTAFKLRVSIRTDEFWDLFLSRRWIKSRYEVFLGNK